MKLRVQIGSNAHDLQTAWVNCEDKPTEVENEYWIGRVFVRVRDFDGLTPDGSPPQTHSPYFEGRNRKFHIQAEGRFKKPYNGDQVWFGTQFDHMIDNFPETLFNTGMRIAKYIDPATFYDKTSPTPYIMSPYLACVNTLSAWPAPSRAHDAVLTLENGEAPTASDDEHNEDDVPVAEIQHSKKQAVSKPIRYWSFAGFREDETGTTLTRKVSRSSQLSSSRPTSGDAAALMEETRPRSGSLATTGSGSAAARFDPDASVVAGHPSHGRALRRLGSYSRLGGPTEAEGQSPAAAFHSHSLSAFPEDASESDSEDDGMSFHTAFEDQYEEVVAEDGTTVVKKKKKGLSVKKVRKSLHIPSAKTIERNMRSLSIKRKDKPKQPKVTAASAISPSIASDETQPRKSGEENRGCRRSLDLMRPFRSHKADKDSQHSQGSGSGSGTPMGRHSIALDHDIAARQRAAVGVTPLQTTLQPPRQPEVRVPLSAGPVLGSGETTFPGRAPLNTLPEDGTLQTRDFVASSTAPVSSPQQGGMQRPGSTISTAESNTGSDHTPTRSIAEQSLTSINGTQAAARPGSSSTAASSMADPPAVRRASGEASQPQQQGERFPSKTVAAGKSIRADQLATPDAAGASGLSHKFDAMLGPWRFSNPAIEPIEDTAFLDGGSLAGVKERRRHFAKSQENREEFVFDEDIVYCMSFFLPYMNFNTFDIKLGPLGTNLRKYVPDQPVRYMARSAEDASEVFFMINFELVDA